LLDTRVLIWALIVTDCLPQRFVYALRSKYNEIFFSAASIWEIATIREATYWAPGFTAREIAEAARATGFIELPVRSDAAAKFRRFRRFTTTRSDVVRRETAPLFRRYGAFPATAR
jgi:PIN domain nuclease of toxin-antitoxin system